VDDRSGVDFWAELRGGAKLRIDIKARQKGCSAFWSPAPLFGKQVEPELSLEKWSVVPGSSQLNRIGCTGWTLDEGKATDYTLHVFDPSDTREVVLLPFQLLRMAFIKNIASWYGAFRSARQKNTHNGHHYESECVFVPAWCVIAAIQAEMRVGRNQQ